MTRLLKSCVLFLERVIILQKGALDFFRVRILGALSIHDRWPCGKRQFRDPVTRAKVKRNHGSTLFIFNTGQNVLKNILTF